MKQLSTEQRELVLSLASKLGAIPGVRAVVLGGSHARGRAQETSDIDLGLLYSERAPFSVEEFRDVAKSVNDAADPVVTDFYQWGPWVNGGAWLTIGGQRVDFLYRSLEHLERVIVESEAGRYELHYLQQPPFGFFSGTYLGEIAICIPIFDPDRLVDGLKKRVAVYPEAMRRSVVRDFLFMAEFTITTFAPKFAARTDTYGTASCLTRAVNEVVMALFALNRKYPVNDKTALEEVAEFEQAPQRFGSRVQAAFAKLGTTPGELSAAVQEIGLIVRETTEVARDLYQARYVLPK